MTSPHGLRRDPRGRGSPSCGSGQGRKGRAPPVPAPRLARRRSPRSSATGVNDNAMVSLANPLPASSDAEEGGDNDPPPRADRAAHPSHVEANSPSRPSFSLSCHVSSWDDALVTGTTRQGEIGCKVRREDRAGGGTGGLIEGRAAARDTARADAAMRWQGKALQFLVAIFIGSQ